MSNNPQPINDNLEVSIQTVSSSTLQPDKTFKHGKETLVFISLQKQSSLNPLVGLRPRAALNLLAWLEQKRGTLEDLAQEDEEQS